MGGSGKTTLAAHAAHLMRDRFADGVLWANVATSTPQDILAVWGRAYGYDFSGLADLESRSIAMRGVLAEKSALIMVDNVTDAAQVRALLPGSSSCAVSLTTRDLDVATALNAQPILLDELSATGSLQLLVHILGKERVEAEQQAAEDICALLHHLPLAVEIAGQRLKSRPRLQLAAMARRLRHERHRLNLEISDQAVRTSFAVSWDGLDDELQRIFALLAVFEGRSFSSDATAHLAAVDAFDAEEHLYALVALSLVKEEEAGTFRQHPLLADFAHEQLIQEEEAYARMAAYYATFAQQHKQNYATLEPEWGNISAAIEVAHGQEDWALVMRIVEALHQTWLTRGRYGDARQAYKLAEEAAEQLRDDALQTQTLLRWGSVCLEQNDYEEAQELLTAGLFLAYELEEGESIADAQYNLARIAIERSDYDEARHALTECEAIREELGDPLKLAETYVIQARLYFGAEPNYERAEQLGQKALRMLDKAEAPEQYAQTLLLLAQVANAQEKYQEALGYAERAQTIYEECQNSGELATVLYVLVTIHVSLQNYAIAKEIAEQSLLIFRHLGIRRLEGMVLFQMSMIYNEVDKVDEVDEVAQALTSAAESRFIFNTLADQLGEAFALRVIGDLYKKRGDRERAQMAWLEARTIANKLGRTTLVELVQKRLDDL